MDPLEIAVAALRLALVLVLYAFLLAVLRAARGGLGTASIEARPAPEPVVASQSRAAAHPRRPAVPHQLALLLPSGERKELAAGAVLGRGVAADLRIDDPTVSGSHARFERDEHGWHVRDLGSTNGSSVNGARVAERMPVRPGDTVALGGVELRVQ